MNKRSELRVVDADLVYAQLLAKAWLLLSAAQTHPPSSKTSPKGTRHEQHGPEEDHT
jgi:hypothetical protein